MVRIVICDEHKLFRDLLKIALCAIVGFEVVGDFADGFMLLDNLEKGLSVDVLLLEINLQGKNGYELANSVRHNFSFVKIVAISALTHPSLIKGAKSDRIDPLIPVLQYPRSPVQADPSYPV